MMLEIDATTTPLYSRSVLLLREADLAAHTVDYLSALGVDVSCIPLIMLSPNKDFSVENLFPRCIDINSPIVLALTSPTAASLFFSLSPSLPDPILIAAIGHRTALQIQKAGYPIDIQPQEETAEGLAQAIIDHLGDHTHGAYCLHPTSNKSKPTLHTHLSTAGIHCNEPILYTNEPTEDTPQERERLSPLHPDAIVFYSPSSAEVFFRYVQSLGWRSIPRVAIGPVTAQAMISLGIPPTEVAGKPSDIALHAALIRIFGSE